NILVTFSGNKGYHVTIFFDDVIDVNLAKRFYYIVLQRLDYKSDEIEFRATNSQGVKLPFSVHQKTGKSCYLVDNRTLEQTSIENFKKVRQLDKENFEEWFKNQYSSDEVLAAMQDVESTLDKTNKEIILTQKEVRQIKAVKDDLTLDKGITNETKIQTVKTILEENRLIYTNSRHQMTYYIAMYLRDIGYERESTKEVIKKEMLNSFRQTPALIEPSLEHTLSEIEKIVKITYKKG